MAKILVIEDDTKTAEFVSKHLTAAGHTCMIEGSGANALEVAKQNDLDLVVLDIMLPGTSGFEVCRRMRRDADLYTIPILILSAMNEEEEVLHGLAQGADDYVVKPFEIQNLIQRVEALLRAGADSQVLDSITQLPGADSTKREIQKRISRGGHFALACGELVHLREFAYRFGPDSRTKAIRHLSRALGQCGAEYPSDRFYVGHMGGGHFVCVLPPDAAQAYCVHLYKLWRSHLEKFYESIGQSKAYNDALSPSRSLQTPPLIDVLFCITMTDPTHAPTPHGMFEVLSQIRAKALEAKAGGVHLDRRT
ncbi:MAG: response regulator [Candidatus Hydrogenedentes bacterium]|nr:response regulator [Candidatus Hydrogenedentota bacterium]